MRHLTLDLAVAALRRGKPVEQLLGGSIDAGAPTVRWVTISPCGGEFAVRLHHVYDQGDVDFRDLSAFAPVDDDEYAGEGVESARAPHPEDALTAAADYGATPDRWVNFGVLADEYGDYRGWS